MASSNDLAVGPAEPSDAVASRAAGHPRWFWLLVLGALSQTAPGVGGGAAVDGGPGARRCAITERLTRLGDRVRLVVDDVHELGPAQAGRQLELLVMRGPLELRRVLATPAVSAPAAAGGVVVLGSRTYRAGHGTSSHRPRVP